jgi:hypothetical protein
MNIRIDGNLSGTALYTFSCDVSVGPNALITMSEVMQVYYGTVAGSTENVLTSDFILRELSAVSNCVFSSPVTVLRQTSVLRGFIRFLLCRQQNLRLFGESSASPTIKKTTMFVQIILAGVAGNRGSGSRFIVTSINRPGRPGLRSPTDEKNATPMRPTTWLQYCDGRKNHRSPCSNPYRQKVRKDKDDVGGNLTKFLAVEDTAFWTIRTRSMSEYHGALAYASYSDMSFRVINPPS